ncbi:MAG TPA: hypothetical protein VFH39_03360 [Candidatus Saccharimonadales bacterium]|nr:hypothetical protein [Candidatus Saccharimonadales bacterium]
MAKDKRHPMSTDMNDADLKRLDNFTDPEQKLLQRDAPSVEGSEASKPSNGHKNT